MCIQHLIKSILTSHQHININSSYIMAKIKKRNPKNATIESKKKPKTEIIVLSDSEDDNSTDVTTEQKEKQITALIARLQVVEAIMSKARIGCCPECNPVGAVGARANANGNGNGVVGAEAVGFAGGVTTRLQHAQVAEQQPELPELYYWFSR